MGKIEMMAESEVITHADLDKKFLRAIRQKAGADFSRCFQCKTCSAGCPFSEIMDPFPNVVMRFVQLGLMKEALECSTIWICVSCNTCSIQCPQAIDIPGVMDALRQMAISKKAHIAEPDIVHFHNEVLHSIKKYGRTHKLEIMMKYKLKRDWFGDLDVGLKMLAKRKLDLTPSKIKKAGVMKKLFKKYKLKQI
ncbi:MAG: 4Fe-4S dicluster domain-containing protein [Deltaproteobacteria bacterium]|nr:4Fe-4S dicluster domain-containing protein [Deltaproteobacteria bacterium]